MRYNDVYQFVNQFVMLTFVVFILMFASTIVRLTFYLDCRLFVTVTVFIVGTTEDC